MNVTGNRVLAAQRLADGTIARRPYARGRAEYPPKWIAEMINDGEVRIVRCDEIAGQDPYTHLIETVWTPPAPTARPWHSLWLTTFDARPHLERLVWSVQASLDALEERSDG